MRTNVAAAVLFLMCAALAAPAWSAEAPASTSFISWALDRSSECDARWNAIASPGGAAATRPDRTAALNNRADSPPTDGAGSKLHHSVITTRSFIHGLSWNETYLPLTTRPRNGASRGVSKLSSPADAMLSLPNATRRPLNSSIQQKQFIRQFGGSISRPKLRSFGRLGTADRHGLGTPTRPASRVARPRIL
jgi:hypothetical protein